MMPRIFFTGRRKIARSKVSVVLRPGRPPEFQATIDLAQLPRSIPRTAEVVVEAYHNTMIQRFDFGTVADCRPRETLRLTNFDEWDRPYFRVLVVGVERDPGVVLAACDSVDAVDPEVGAVGGRSKLKLRPKPDTVMRGELWKVGESGGAFELWYNKDVHPVATRVKGKHPETLGLMLPSAVREILARTHLWGGVSTDASDWTNFAVTLSGEPFPVGEAADPPLQDDVEEWIDTVMEAFCRRRGRFVELIAAMEDSQS